MMQKHFRKKPPAGDEAGANGDNGGIASRSAPQKMALSFDPDEEGPTVKIKKKKKRSHALPPASNGPLPVAPAPSTGTSGTYSVDFLQKLRASQRMRTVEPEASAGDADISHSAGDRDVAGVPSADAVRLAREARERARRIAADDDDERGAGAAAGYIPLTDAEDGASDMLVARMAEELRPSEAEQAERSRGGGSGRLVREEQEEELGLDEMGGARGRAGRPRVTFGAALGAGGGSAGVVPSSVWRGTDARHANTVVEVEVEQNERRRDSALRRGAGAAESAADGSSDSLAALAAQLSATDFVSALDDKMAGQIGSLRLTLSQQKYEGEQAQLLLQQCTADAAALEEELQRELGSFELLQRAQAFTESLLDSLEDKAPQVERIEGELADALQALHMRRLAMREAERAAECARAERVLGGAWVRPGLISLCGSSDALLPSEAGTLLARIEGARMLRRRGAAARGEPAAADWRDGWSSAEEVDAHAADAEDDACGSSPTLGTHTPGAAHAGQGAAGGERGRGTLARLRARVEAAAQAAEPLFDHAVPELSDLQLVRGRFHHWQVSHRSSYEQAYIELCLPTLLAPLVRHRLLQSDPITSGAVDAQSWHRDIASAGASDGGSPAGVCDVLPVAPPPLGVSPGDVAAGAPAATAAGPGAAAGTPDRVLLAQLTCKLALPRLKQAVLYSWRVRSVQQNTQLRLAVQSVSTAARALAAAAARGWRMAEGGAVQEEPEAAEAAETAAADVKALLMTVAMRLEGAVDETCIPPCTGLLPVGVAQTPAPADEAAAAGSASRRQLWRTLKLLCVLGLWGDILAPDALQELLLRLLTAHVVPYLQRCLSHQPPQWELAVAAVETAARAIPLPWRRRDPSGAFSPWTAPLVAFVVAELSPLLPDPSTAKALMALLTGAG